MQSINEYCETLINAKRYEIMTESHESDDLPDEVGENESDDLPDEVGENGEHIYHSKKPAYDDLQNDRRRII